jgi:hypothetical protein
VEENQTHPDAYTRRTTNLLSHNEQRRHEKWRKLQRRALRIPLSVFAVKSVLIMNPVCDTPPGRRSVRDPTAFELRRKLEELIAALARRIPHHERAGEAAILGDAEELRREALRRLAVLDDETAQCVQSDTAGGCGKA